MRRLIWIIVIEFILFVKVTTQAQEIFEAVKAGNLLKVKALVETDPHLVNSVDSIRQTPFHLACNAFHPEIVKYFIENGADVNACDNNGLTPLDHAADKGNKEIINLLLDKGADYDTTGGKALYMLQLSAWYGLDRLFKLALSKGGDRLLINNAENRTTMQLALKGGSVEIVKILTANKIPLEKGTDIYGLNPLHYAVRKGNLAMTEFLANNGVDINSRNALGESPYNMAESEANRNMQDLILKLGGSTGRQKIPCISGPYLGQTPPENKSKIFAPGFISTQLGELNSVFTQTGKEFYFSRRGKPGKPSAIMVSKLSDNVWSIPVPVNFTGIYNDIDLFVTADDNWMIFSSDRPDDNEDKVNTDYNFWISKRTADKWGKPVRFAEEAVSESDDFFPVVTRSGNLYFNSQRGGPGTNDVFCSVFIGGGYTKAERLPEPINTAYREFDAFVSQDEKMIIFSSSKPGGFGGSDIYVSFRGADDNWTLPVNLGNDINSSASEYGATISPDGKYLFYTSSKNGTEDIFWISSKIIKDIKQKK
jgi:ankyrin repeat protein